jgi:hypothetical protein
VASNILLFFLQKERKTKQKNNKILPATSACCGAVVRNECMDHFSPQYFVVDRLGWHLPRVHFLNGLTKIIICTCKSE